MFLIPPLSAARSRLSCAFEVHVPQPVPPGPYGPVEQPDTIGPVPERLPPEIDEPLAEPTLPIREPIVRRPQVVGGRPIGGQAPLHWARSLVSRLQGASPNCRRLRAR